jgi:protein-tyrosine-phosphatase/DNA-binding transcriptional ArsR family regulator
VQPPAFLQLAAHPLRWQLLTELARSDRRVGELCERAGQRQSLVSYHLRRLRDGGLVSARRSIADGRDSYYVLDLGGCEARMRGAAAALHPAFGTVMSRTAGRQAQVLFLCTGNSGRSPMAEALIEHLSDGTVSAESAGSHPRPLHPGAVAALEERGIDIAGRAPKHLDEFAGRRFDRVITLCDRVREVCPEFPGAEPIHWSVRDPARPGAPGFEQTADELATRILFLLATMNPATEEVAYA